MQINDKKNAVPTISVDDRTTATPTGFVDNRPAFKQQQPLIGAIQTRALRHPGSGIAKPVLQAKVETVKGKLNKTEIKFTSGPYDYVDLDDKTETKKKAEVGTKMEAILHLDDPVKGQATGPQWKWMDSLKKKSKTRVIRGHLLNHDLGGPALPYNLFPISGQANQQHSIQVEQKVKDALFSGPPKASAGSATTPASGTGTGTSVAPTSSDVSALDEKTSHMVTYHVDVTARDDDAGTATFTCAWGVGKKLGTPVAIPSDLKNAGQSYRPGGKKTATPFKIPEAWSKSPGGAIAEKYKSKYNIEVGTTTHEISAVAEGSSYKREKWEFEKTIDNLGPSTDVFQSYIKAFLQRHSGQRELGRQALDAAYKDREMPQAALYYEWTGDAITEIDNDAKMTPQEKANATSKAVDSYAKYLTYTVAEAIFDELVEEHEEMDQLGRNESKDDD